MDAQPWSPETSLDPRLEGQRFGAEPPSDRERSCLGGCLKGCLIALGIAVIIGIIAGIWIWRNWRNWAATFGTQAVQEAIDKTQLPGEEKRDINIQVERVAEAFRAGRLSLEQVRELLENLADSPLMTSMVASAIQAQYISKSGLSKEEQAEATITLRRFLRGVMEHKIDGDEVELAMRHVARRGEDGTWELKQQISDEDLRKFLETAKAEADEAEIPPEPVDFDPSDELKKIVDKALGD